MRKFDPDRLPPRPTLDIEIALWSSGILRIAGIDEAGRGPLAGPVSAAAVILPPDRNLCQVLHGVCDSKAMTPSDREVWACRLKEVAVAYGVGFASAAEIDRLGIVMATYLAVRRALKSLPKTPQHLLLDYIHLPGSIFDQTSLVKGDARSLSIASASVLAKTARDALMGEMDSVYPGYGFNENKGYGTQAHREALQRIGPCSIHRMSFGPLKESTER